MKALQIMKPGEACVVEIPKPEPGPGQVLVKVMAVTTCPQWDMHIFQGRPMFGSSIAYPYPAGQPGHEMTGIIETIGAGVSGFAPGDRVVAWRALAYNLPGCYAEYVVFDPANLLPLPEGARFDDYAALELAMCVGVSFLDILRTTSFTGKAVAISGLGPGGLVAARFAKAEGAASVIGFETNARRAALAPQFGVDRVVNPLVTPPEELRVNRRRPAAIALDCVGSKASAEYLFRITTEIVALFGVQREGYLYPPDGPLKLFGYSSHTRQAAEYALEKMRAGAVPVGDLISRHMGLEDYGEAVALLQSQEALKICFWPNGRIA